jgi:hypothetical protein
MKTLFYIWYADMQECSNWTAAASNSAPLCAGVCTVTVEKEQQVEKTDNVGFVIASSIYDIYGMQTCLN